MEFKDWFKARRMQLNLTQVDVAQALGISKQAVFQWEVGDSKPAGIRRVRKLANLLNVDIAEIENLIDGEEEVAKS